MLLRASHLQVSHFLNDKLDFFLNLKIYDDKASF